MKEKWKTTRFPRHLNTISNLFIVAVHYTHMSTCYVSLLLLTESATASFEDLVALRRRTLQQIF